jgi:hypothetical protein
MKSARRIALFLLIGLILTCAAPVKADPLLLGTSFAFPPQTGFQIQQDQFLAQAFSLDKPVVVTVLRVQLYASATITAPFLVQLTNGLGSAVHVLAEEAFTFPPLPHDTPHVFSLNTNLSLTAGTYFVVLSSTFTSGTLAWGAQTAVPSTVGSVGLSYHATNPPQNTNPAFPPGSNWSIVTSGPDGRGPLQFQIEGVPPTIQIGIDIKPGNFPNSINPRSKGVIPVAVMTTATFDATTVDPTTVFFGVTGTEAAPVHSDLSDIDRDGDFDMILHFKTQDTGIMCGDTSASLTGQTFSKQAIQGSDTIVTVGCKN